MFAHQKVTPWSDLQRQDVWSRFHCLRVTTATTWTPEGCCLVQHAKRVQQPDASPWRLLAGCDLWREGEGLQLGCGLLVPHWSQTGNTQQLVSESACMLWVFTWASEDTDPPGPPRHPWQGTSPSACAHPPLPHGCPEKMWMDGLLNTEITSGAHVLLVWGQYCTTQRAVHGKGCENTT